MGEPDSDSEVAGGVNHSLAQEVREPEDVHVALELKHEVQEPSHTAHSLVRRPRELVVQHILDIQLPMLLAIANGYLMSRIRSKSRNSIKRDSRKRTKMIWKKYLKFLLKL